MTVYTYLFFLHYNRNTFQECHDFLLRNFDGICGLPRLSLSVIKVAVDKISRIEIVMNVYEANGGELTSVRIFIKVGNIHPQTFQTGIDM